MGFRHDIKRSTLADANETRDWHIYAEFAQRLIAQARTLYARDNFGIEVPIPPGPNLVTARGLDLLKSREAELAALVTRDSMIGTAKVAAPRGDMA